MFLSENEKMSNNNEKEMNNDGRNTKSRARWCSCPDTSKTLWEEVVMECKQIEDVYMERWLDENSQCDDAMSEHFKRVLYHTLIPAFKTMCALIVQKKVIKDRKQLFDPIDCLAEILYNTNRKHPHRYDNWKSSHKVLNDPYRCDKKLRPVYPTFWLWSREEAAVKIQALVRGVLSRVRVNLEDMKVFFRHYALFGYIL